MPLCEYDLRGLPGDRCPECGHAFDRATLRQLHDDRQQWFFEHARQRRLLAFVRTTLASLAPARFWSRVRAGHVIVVPRLRAWAAAWTFFTAATVLAAIVGRIVQATSSIQSFVSPPLGWRNAVHLVLIDDNAVRVSAALLAVAFAWPIVTVVMLGAFGQTLDRAGVRPAHLWRIALYASPSALLPVLLLVVTSIRLGLIDSLIDLPMLPIPFSFGLPPSWSATVWIVVAATTIHVAAAHVRYLRVRHAIAQALLVQLMTWLALAAAAFAPRALF